MGVGEAVPHAATALGPKKAVRVKREGVVGKLLRLLRICPANLLAGLLDNLGALHRPRGGWWLRYSPGPKRRVQLF